MQQAVPVQYFVCTLESAQDEVRLQRRCDWWIFDWPNFDRDWLFGNTYWWIQPPLRQSPLAYHYYSQLTNDLNTQISQAQASCESRRYPGQSTPPPGMRLNVSSRLQQGSRSQARSEKSGERTELSTRLSVGFAPGSGPQPPTPCQPIPRELFECPVDFDYTLYGPANDNFRWELRDAQPLTPDAYFELYGRTLKFNGSNTTQLLGGLHLIIDRVADLRVRFESRQIPPVITGRVDPNQALSYQVSTGNGFFNIAAIVELQHIESGQIHSASIHGPDYAPGQMPGYGWWPDGWAAMSMDANGVIQHHHIDWFYWINTIDPASRGLPGTGTYRLRYILLTYGYRTENRYVSSSVLGSSGDTRMSWQPIGLSHMPSLTTYTPGMTKGIIPPFELTYTRSPILADGIEFDAVFDLKNDTTFRFVVKVGNTFDFALGLIVQASGWQAWVSLLPGETKYLAGAVSISGMANWNAYPLHPQSPYYGWGGNWGSGYISMNNGVCTIPFSLFLTAPNAPETMPAHLPSLQASQRWYWDLASFGPQYEPKWGMIKRYAADGRYDYENNLEPFNLSVGLLKTLNVTTTQPSNSGLIDPASYFATGYNTSTYDGSPWHKRPWPTYSSWSSSAPIMCKGEQRHWDGAQYVWTAVDEISVSLTREMLQQVSAALGVAEHVVMDGDDIRWFQIGPGGSWHNLLWIDRFYTRNGTLINDTAMRAAFQSAISASTGDWPDYRNLVVHPAVRFGSFLDNGGFEMGDYLLGTNGAMTEVSSLSDLALVSSKFLYHISLAFQ
jgi:hypothetical protein